MHFQKSRGVCDYELSIWGGFPRNPRFLTPRPFFSRRMEIEIYTGARDRQHMEKMSSIGNPSPVWGSFNNNKCGSLRVTHPLYSLGIGMLRNYSRSVTWAPSIFRLSPITLLPYRYARR